MKRALLLLLAATSLGAQSVKQVTVTIASPSLALGSRTTAVARARLANGTYTTTRYVVWSSSKPTVALVSDKGIVSSIAAGTASIVGAVNGVAGIATVVVIGAPPVDPPPTPTPASVASVSVTVVSNALTTGATTTASSIARDSSGDVLTGRSTVWSSLMPSIASVNNIGFVTALSTGSATIRGTVESKFGDATVTVTTPSPPPDADAPTLPTLMTTTVASTPSAGRSLSVASGGNLQAALDSAVLGDRITLECGATFTGNFTLAVKSTGTGWVTVQSACTIPAEGTRTDTTQSFAKIVSANTLPAIATTGAASKWRFIGVELATTCVASCQSIVSLGCNLVSCETAANLLPSDIIFDRSYIHATSATDIRACLRFNAGRLAIVESIVMECHSTFDAQAISGWNGPGPFKIVNNYLEASTEVIAFGGSDPSITNQIPSDIEITRNHITKRMAWKASAWLVKNLVEFKMGRRVLIEGNVIENNWVSAQQGFAFVLWSVNQQTTCTWCVTEHVTIQNNLIRNVAGGWTMDGVGSNGLTQYAAVAMNHVLIKNNVVIGLDNALVGNYGRIFEISATTTGKPIANLTIEHNTAFSPSNSSFIWAGGGLPMPNHIVKNNLVGGGLYQMFSVYGQGQIAWDHAGGTGSSFLGNTVAVFSGGTMVPGNLTSGSFADIGLVGGPGAATSVNASLDDLAIQAGSGYANTATDGTNPGANITVVKAATLGVVRP